MDAPVAQILPDGKRLHLQHGPIDLIILAAERQEIPSQAAYSAAESRFATVLSELVAELPELRSRVGRNGKNPSGRIGKRMAAAVQPFAGSAFITPMAAVAGAVADEILECMKAVATVDRAFVNNGGDIALHLSTGKSFRTAVTGLDNAALGCIRIDAEDGVGGIATSGRGGRSLSMGIADSVTILAKSAAAADAAATLIANAVDLPGNRAIERVPANSIDPDSDLGNRLVVVNCEPLMTEEINAALASGVQLAQNMRKRGLMHSAILFLSGVARVVGIPDLKVDIKEREAS